MVSNIRRIAIAGFALGVALPIMASAQDIHLATGGSELIYKGTNVNTRSGAWLDAGDISGDGRRDLVVGAPGTITVPGAVYIIYGGPERSGELSLSTADVSITSAEAGSFFGIATAIGNVTAAESNPKNLAIGAPGAFSGRGAVYLYASGWGTGASLTTGDAVYTVLGAAGDQLGAALATGDLDNDGLRELIIGAPGNNRVYIIKGRSTLSGTLDLSTQSASASLNVLGFGYTVTAGDITGDGTDDLLVGNPVQNAVYVYAGTNTAIPTTAVTGFAGINPGDAAGSSVRLLDFDGDGSNDLVVGAPGGDGPTGDSGRTDAGHVYVFLGPVVDGYHSLSEAHAVIYGAAANDRAGDRLVAGDINRDTAKDLVIFSPGAASGAGELQIYYGRDRSSIGTVSGSTRVVDFATAGQVSRRIVGDPSAGVIAAALVYEITPAGGRAVIVGVPGIDSNTGKVFFTASSRGPGWTPADPNPTGPAPPPGPTPTADTRIALNRTGLYFGGTNNGALLSSAQTAAVLFTNGSGSWSVATDATWLTISPAAGTGSASFSVSVKPGSYPNGLVRTGTITVTAPGVPNSPISIPVQLTIIASPTAPDGLIETPVDNITGVTGSIAVTGWVLDDIGVTEVSIWRDPIAGEPVSNGKVFIGNAVRIDGARPDVDAIAAVPFDYMAGWGYLLLTNMLPNQGNGTFVLYAYATDVEGHTTLLGMFRNGQRVDGSKTITGDNAHASRPFGAIDTPAQGETISGSSYVNFGWVLGAQDNVIPTDGSTITVFIDGVPVGHPQYNFARDDIRTLFPGHANTDGAIGFYVLDTTMLSNGVHTIAWGVTDAAGHSEGIGSRFFTVLNGSSSSVMTTPALVQGSNGTEAVTRHEAAAGSETGQPVVSVNTIAASDVPSYAQLGFSMNAPLEILETNEAGSPKLTIEEVGVVRATVGAPVDGEGSYEGYFIKGGRLESLPAGAFLDAKTGEFFWQPGVGFVGTYEFVFIRKANGARERIPLSVVIEPRGRAKGMLLPSRTIR